MPNIFLWFSRFLLNKGLSNDKVSRYLIDQLFKKLPQIVNTISIMPVIVAFVFWGRVSDSHLLIWTVGALLISVLRYGLAWQYNALSEESRHHGHWLLAFIGTSICSGIIWGGAGMFLFQRLSGLDAVLLYGAIIGLSAGCVVIASYSVLGYFAFSIPAIGLSAFDMLSRHDIESVALGGMMIVLFLIITKAAFNQQQDAKRATRLLFENMDLIEQLQTQKAIAEKADADKSRFLAAASHDLRQPLHAMQLYLSSVNPTLGLTKQPQVWQGLQRSMDSLHALFNSLLDLSRLDAGMLEPNWQAFSLKALVDGFIEEYIAQAQQKGLQLFLPAPDVAVCSDPALLETIIRNLLSNAIRYTATGSVTLNWSKHSETTVLLEVIDTGVGIPSGYQQEIFNEYFQINNPERDKNKGLGLGLAIVRRLAKLLRCDISVSSSQVGGATFYLMLPAADTAQPLSRLADQASASQEFSGVNVWIVDDEALVREGMTHLLERWGCQVTAFDGLAEVTAYWRQTQQMPDMVIADYRLRNHENGAQVLTKLSAFFKANVPGLIITGDTSPERLREAQSQGFPLMFKPVNEARMKIFMRQSLRA